MGYQAPSAAPPSLGGFMSLCVPCSLGEPEMPPAKVVRLPLRAHLGPFFLPSWKVGGLWGSPGLMSMAE